ncbi:MAG: hypothetical protein JO332_14785 [Planctomycetaceae bacterium]|nr:hypothetical protein [Planctomycetaceae bacterium]
MKGRRIALLIPVLIAVAVPVGMLVLPARSLPEQPPAQATLAVASSEPPRTPGNPDPPADSAPRLPAECWLQVTLELPAPMDYYDFTALVFATGTVAVEEHVEHANIDHFAIGPLKPGKKGVLLYSARGYLGPVAAMVEMAEKGDTPLTLRPGNPTTIEGTVVDASGKGVPGLEVEFTVEVPLGQRLLAEGATHYGVFSGGGATSSRFRRSESYGFSVSPTETGFRLSQSKSTGEEGRFSMRWYSSSTPVVLRIRKGTRAIKEESFLPSASPLRVVIPGVEDPSK